MTSQNNKVGRYFATKRPLRSIVKLLPIAFKAGHLSGPSLGRGTNIFFASAPLGFFFLLVEIVETTGPLCGPNTPPEGQSAANWLGRGRLTPSLNMINVDQWHGPLKKRRRRGVNRWRCLQVEPSSAFFFIIFVDCGGGWALLFGFQLIIRFSRGHPTGKCVANFLWSLSAIWRASPATTPISKRVDPLRFIS